MIANYRPINKTIPVPVLFQPTGVFVTPLLFLWQGCEKRARSFSRIFFFGAKGKVNPIFSLYNAPQESGQKEMSEKNGDFLFGVTFVYRKKWPV